MRGWYHYGSRADAYQDQPRARCQTLVKAMELSRGHDKHTASHARVPALGPRVHDTPECTQGCPLHLTPGTPCLVVDSETL